MREPNRHKPESWFPGLRNRPSSLICTFVSGGMLFHFHGNGTVILTDCVCVCVFDFGLHCVFVAAQAFSCRGCRGHSLPVCEAFLQWLLSSQSTGSRRMDFSSCRAWASLFQRIWNLPGPGTEPVFSALAGRPLSNVPSGKSLY